MDDLKGSIESIVFSSEESGFTVARLKLPSHRDLTTIVGIMPTIQEGETIACHGLWKHHPQHGRQFDVQSYETKEPEDLMGIQKYLESGLIKGIGPHYAKKIVSHYGLKTLEILDKAPTQLLDIEGIGPKRIEMIQKCWQEQRSIRQVMIFLQSHNIRSSFAQKIYKRYGDQSIEKLKENPYALAKEIFGIGFKTADQLAQNLGIEKNSPLRIAAGLQHTLWELGSEGHVCYPHEKLMEKTAEILECEEDLCRNVLKTLVEDGEIVQNKLDEAEYVWLKPVYLWEMGIARELKRLNDGPSMLRSINTEKAIEWVQEALKLNLAKEQIEAVCQSMKEKVHIITGGPGTGKSTITRAILTLTSQLTDSILLLAPTGRAAKRMSEITGRKAFTIHSRLEFDFQKGGFKKSRENPLEGDLIIVDEASMIDTQLMYNLLRAIPEETRVIFIGDIDQLPSVGPGNVLKDMIASKKVLVSQLVKIFRQAANSRIVTNAHRINHGEFPDIEPIKGSDFVFLEEEDVAKIGEKIVELTKVAVPDHFGFDSIEDIQILAPMKRGGIGTESLNHLLQQALNPQPHPLQRMGRSFQLQDKVMQIRNNYDKEVYNGDVGRIVDIDLEEQVVIVNYDGRRVHYDFTQLDEIMLAYAVSIHKYQGSECPCVIIPVHTSHFKLLFRNLLYTGITRGKKLVVLIGTKKALALCVHNNDVHQRYTGLREMIEEVL